MTADSADPLDRATAELGEPDAVFSVSPGRVRVKLTIAGLLILYGFVANYFWWVHGPAKFEHLILVVLFGPPILGLSMLRHISRARGLHVLVYPTGLLRVHGSEVESFPWAEVDEVRLRADQGEVEIEHDDAGRLLTCWIAVEPPLMKFWDAGLTLHRADGAEATLTPALADYPELVELVQRGTFPLRWAGVWDRYRAGQVVEFGPFEATWAGLTFGKNSVPWVDVAEVAVSQKNFTVKRPGKWLPWASAELSQVPDPHLLAALINEAKRHASGVPEAEDAEAEADS